MIKRIELFLTVLLIISLAWLICDLARETGSPEPPKETEALAEAQTDEGAQKLPARYDAREEGRQPSVKNQGRLGTCWAVAASSALEASLLPQEELVFSADHLSLHHHFARTQDDGGDYTMAMAYLAGWQGPVTEAEDPYGDGISPDGLYPAKHVQEMQVLKNKDYEGIKRAILRCGSVQSSIYMDMQNAFSASVYYNQLEHSYYYDGNEQANHDILIIGWDDFYDASRFNRSSQSNGAFICQNSWGTDFGEEGVFYISYADVNIGKNCVAYTLVEETDNYDRLYQTDLCGWVGQLGYGDGQCYFANVYRAQGQESLEAVGFYATGRNTQYRLYVVDKFQDETSFFPREAVQSGQLEEMGYYTVPLQEPVFLEAGEPFAVLVEINTPGSVYPVATEYVADEATKTVDISDGEGYISHNGAVWSRVEAKHAANVCLKAYTKNRT